MRTHNICILYTMLQQLKTTPVIVDFYGMFYALFGEIITRTKLVLRITSFWPAPGRIVITVKTRKIRPNQSSMDGCPSGASILHTIYTHRVIYRRAHRHFFCSALRKYVFLINLLEYYFILYCTSYTYLRHMSNKLRHILTFGRQLERKKYYPPKF